MEPTKTIIVRFLPTEEEKEIKIGVNEKIKDLKIKIEQLYNINISSNSRIYKSMYRRNLTCLPNDDKTIKESRIRDGDCIILGKEPI